jgi:hypothetical protein
MDEQQPHHERRAQYPCADHEKRLALTEQAVMSIKHTNEGLTTKMDILISTMTKVALLEEKHSTQQVDVSRAHDKIGKVEKTIEQLAIESREFINYTKGQNQVLWALAAGVAMLAVKVLFFASSHGMTP